MKTNNLKSLSKYKIIEKLRVMEKGIKLNCYDCMGGQKRTDCRLNKCPLYNFRPWSKLRD